MPITLSSSSRQQPLHIVNFGPPGSGKTESSLTASPKCPSGYSHLETKGVSRKLPEQVVLDDLLWVTFEPGATIGFGQRNIEVPEIDLSMVPPKEWVAAQRETHAILAKRVADGDTRTIIVDTGTAADYAFQEYVQTQFPSLEGQQFWGKVQQVHRDWFLPLLRIDATFIHLFHADEVKTPMGKGDSAEAQARALMLKREAWGLADINIKVSGGAKALYRGAAGLTVWTRKSTQMVGTPPKPTNGWWFHAEDAATRLDVKRRFEVPPVMPADWRIVKQMIAKADAEPVF